MTQIILSCFHERLVLFHDKYLLNVINLTKFYIFNLFCSRYINSKKKSHITEFIFKLNSKIKRHIYFFIISKNKFSYLKHEEVSLNKSIVMHG